MNDFKENIILKEKQPKSDILFPLTFQNQHNKQNAT